MYDSVGIEYCLTLANLDGQPLLLRVSPQHSPSVLTMTSNHHLLKAIH